MTDQEIKRMAELEPIHVKIAREYMEYHDLKMKELKELKGLSQGNSD